MLTPSAWASRMTIWIPGLRTPRSMPLRYVRSRSAFSASLSWDSPASLRKWATLRPNCMSVELRLGITPMLCQLASPASVDYRLQSERRLKAPPLSDFGAARKGKLKTARLCILPIHRSTAMRDAGGCYPTKNLPVLMEKSQRIRFNPIFLKLIDRCGVVVACEVF